MTALTVATWNINSVRLRIKLVEAFLKTHEPDVLCLQETKCPNDLFPLKPLAKLGYSHVALHGQKGHHGVATVSRLPVSETSTHVFCGKDDCRHVAIELSPEGGPAIEIHNFYVPSGGDVPDPDENPKFEHKLAFLDEMADFSAKLKRKRKGPKHRILVGDLNVAPLEHDVWSHKQMLKIVSHTPVEVAGLNDVMGAFGWSDITRRLRPEPEKIYTWWSYRAKDWAASNRGRRLDHIWTDEALAQGVSGLEILSAARGWTQPSDHVPVMSRFDLSGL